MNVFYSSGVSGSSHILSESESKHAVQVLRMKKGEKAILLDGAGGQYIVVILDPHPKKCEVAIISSDFTDRRNFYLHIAIAPTKMNDRMEWFLEKATEIGIDEITPVICTRSERRLTNHERFQKVVVAAIKQSMNPWLPVMNEQCELTHFLNTQQPGLIAHCMQGEKKSFKEINVSANRYTILIGPEGDFSEEELNEATKCGWQSVSLGNNRLRTETAGIVACHTINFLKSN